MPEQKGLLQTQVEGIGLTLKFKEVEGGCKVQESLMNGGDELGEEPLVAG
jgi:hypothetical protein